MRIGIDISQLAFPNTGVGVYTRQLVNGILSIDKENAYILFGSSLRRSDYFRKISFDHESNVQKRLWFLPPRVLTLLWNRLHTIDIETFTGVIDLFHSSDWVEPPSKAKKITTIHDLLVYKYPQYMHPAIVDNQKRKLDWVKKECTKIIADSQSTKNDVVEFLGVNEDRIQVIHLGVDETFVPKEKKAITEVKKKYAIAGEYILSMGTLEPRKNIDRVIKAYHDISQKHGVHLVIVGRFVWGEPPKIDEHIRYIESVDYADLPALYSGARCFVYPSLYEGFGLPVLEAMACHCPVITSDRGSLKEVAGDWTYLVNPEKTESILFGMQHILSLSEHALERMVKEGRAWAKKFTWKKTAEQTLRVYQDVGGSIQ